ncbi:MAG: redox-regulated ATPase YchF [Treponema sp.]|nr:redox-regulated ATPase YchF [Treponema sp.]
MAINCGIVGLPNVGKTAIFSALSSVPAETAQYQVYNENPNIGIVHVPDDRLTKLSEIFRPKRTIPATVEFIDVAGLVKGASKGKGVGNRFLAHIREVGVIAHVVRCFDNPDIVHVSGIIDPESDIETINIELALADIETLAKRRERAERALKVQNKLEQKNAETVLGILDKLNPALEDGKPVRSVPLTPEEKALIYDCHFISAKPQLYVCNVDEEGMKTVINGGETAYVKAVRNIAAAEGSPVVVICGKFEAELIAIEDPAEKQAFLEELGLKEPALAPLIRAAYGLLNLRTFFTTGEDECRAWTIHAGQPAPKAARAIHTDLEKGFIKAEVYTCDDIFHYGTEAQIKLAGKYRIEGKEYIVQDGDVLFIKFNV